MTGTIEKAVCRACGVDVRENTLYCYNCGIKLEVVTPLETNGATVAVNAKAALDDLADKLSQGQGDEDKLAKAATERKRARVVSRKRVEYQWEPRDDAPVLPLIFAGSVGFIALIVVMLLVVWK